MKMNKFVLPIVISLLSFAKIALAGNACQDNPSKALQFTSALMAIDASDGFPFGLLGNSEGNVVSIDQVCNSLVSSSMSASKQAGYTDLTMIFRDKTCVISLQIADDGKVGDFSPFSCTNN